ncbi:hypothetical protein GCM10010331_70950 [Streptomyces xanthochromogenes]|nr:hypothetical protein GCM10010331_70950 [Streptomyces xanthochromogenes]
MPTPPHEVANQLVAAVTAKDAKRVKALLAQGADPNAQSPEGLPLLCVAVAGFDDESAEALTEGGADADRELADGTTPLVRAVDSGSPALVDALIGDAPRRRLPEVVQHRLLSLARHWMETGAEEELRRRTGASGAAVHRHVRDGRYSDVEEFCLGGLTCRAGHSAILTFLEECFGIMTPVLELAARAVLYSIPEKTQVNWFAASTALAGRRSPQDRFALNALRNHPDPVHRILLADVMWSRNFSVQVGLLNQSGDTGQDAECLAVWALEEPDGLVLSWVLEVFADHEHPDQEAIGLRYADHPDPRVRRRIPDLFSRDVPPTDAVAVALLALSRDPVPDVRWATAGELAAHFTPAFREALLDLVNDSDCDVRAQAAIALGASNDRTSAVTDALVSVLDHGEQLVRLEIVYALARRDDPRTDDAWERVGELPPGFGEVDGGGQEDHRLLGYWDYQRRHRSPGSHAD